MTVKAHYLTNTPLVRRFGIRGAKLFARIWFPAAYLVIIVLVTILWLAVSDAIPGSDRLVFGAIVTTFAVMATAVLTRMRLEYWASIEKLEK